MSEILKPLTVEETRLKEEMKRNCLKDGQYKDPKAKVKFDMLCHLEDFEIQYYNLLEENSKIIKMNLNKHKYASEMEGKYILEREKNKDLKEKIENKDRWNQLIADIGFDYDGYRTPEKLMSLIDELVRYSLNARDNYDYLEWLKEGENE